MAKRFLTAQKVVEHLSANDVVSSDEVSSAELSATPLEVLLFVELEAIGAGGLGGNAGLVGQTNKF